MRLVLSFCCLAAGLLVAPLGAGAGPPAMPSPVPLTQGWQYSPDPGDQGLAAGWALGTRGSTWTGVSIPHVFDPRPLPNLFGGTVGWYRVTFTAPALPPGFAWTIDFEQVRRVAQVYLNGRLLGTHSDPYVPFSLPLDGLVGGRPNTVVVRVDNRKGNEPREGWWNWGGITRTVSLVPQGPVVLHDLGLLSQMRCRPGGGCGPASVLVDGWVANRSPSTLSPRVAVSLSPPGGALTAERTVALPALAPGAHQRVRFAVAIPAPRLWSPEQPQLYGATVRTSTGGRLAQLDRMNIGLRSVVVHRGLLYLNGRHIAMRGAAIQEDLPGKGPALTGSDFDTIVSELKAVHANITRAHYLLNPDLLDRLDRAGIMVWSQTPVYHRDELLHTPAQRAFALGTLRGTVLAARNHPSVITHSVANELSVTPDSLPSTRTYLLAAQRSARALDPTLPVSLDLLSYPGYPRQHTYESFDLLGVNNYFGWYTGRPGVHSVAKLANLRPYLLRLRSLYPRQAMVMTEFGAEANINGPTTQKQTYGFQSDYIRRTLGIVDSLPFVGGAIYWTLREFAVKPFWDGGAHRHDVPRDSIHHKGLISYAGVPKPAWSVARALFASVALYPGVGPSAAPVAPALTPGSVALLIAALLGVGALAGLSLRSFLGIRKARQEAPAVAWRVGPGSPGAADTTYA